MHSLVRLRTALTSVLICSLLVGAALAAPSSVARATSAIDIYVAAPDDQSPWISITPTTRAPGAPATILRGRYVRFSGATDEPLIVCAGATDAATQCQTVVPGRDGRCDLPLSRGWLVEGDVRVGRSTVPATGSVAIRLADVDLRRPFALPLTRQDQKLVSEIPLSPRGSFEFCHLAPGAYVVEVALDGGTVHQSERFVVPEVPTSPAALRLPSINVPSGVDLAVDVRGQGGTPVSHAAVEVMQMTGDATAPAIFRKTTDANGQALLTGLQDHMVTMVACGADGYAPTQVRFSRAPSMALCQLHRLSSVRGTVTDERGRAVSNALVRVAGVEVSSSSDGNFRFESVAPGTHPVMIAARDYSSWHDDVTVKPGEELVLGTIVLSAAGEVRGRVIDDLSGAPVAGARVTLQNHSDVAVLSDDDGKYIIAVDRAGEPARVAATGYADLDVTLMPSEREEELRLSRPGSLEVQVWAADGGRCVGCKVNADSERRSTSSSTDATGIARFEALPPGSYYVAQEFARAGAGHVVVSGGQNGKQVTVTAGGRTRVELGTSGEVLHVYLNPPPDPEWSLHAASNASTIAAARLPSGAFELRRLPGESYRLSLRNGAAGVRIASLGATHQGRSLSINIAPTLAQVLLGEPVSGAGPMLEIRDERGEIAAWAPWLAHHTVRLRYLAPGTYTPSSNGRPVGPPLVINDGGTTVVRIP